MGFPILVRWHLFIDSASCILFVRKPHTCIRRVVLSVIMVNVSQSWIRAFSSYIWLVNAFKPTEFVNMRKGLPWSEFLNELFLKETICEIANHADDNCLYAWYNALKSVLEKTLILPSPVESMYLCTNHNRFQSSILNRYGKSNNLSSLNTIMQ